MSNNELRAKYIFNEDFEPDYITGAFGGILPSGDLSIEFYLERTPIPYETIQSLTEEGKIDGDLIVTSPDPTDFKIRRTIKSGVIMNPTTAYNIYKWLKTKLLEMGVNESEL